MPHVDVTRGQSAGAKQAFPIPFRSMAELLTICEAAWHAALCLGLSIAYGVDLFQARGIDIATVVRSNEEA